MEASDRNLEKAIHYLRQHRYAEAEKELRQYLSGNADSAIGLQLLSQSLFYQNRYPEALEANQSAMALAPNNSNIIAQRAQLYMHTEREREAAPLLDQAIQLSPEEPHFRAVRAELHLTMKEYEAALDAANQGLALDANNSFCLNVRAKALVKLERPQDAHSTIATALEQEPENSYTHSNLGWSLLESGQGDQALPHFREALRLAPTNEYGKAGMLEAIKAGNWLYRQFLKYVFWMNRMTAKYQWGFIIGIYVLYRITLGVAQSNPDLAPFLNPLLYGYIAFALSTWFFEPISNLFLFFHRDGRYLLGDKEKMSSRFVAGAALIAIGLIATHFLGNWDHEGFLFLGLGAIAMMIPFASMFRGQNKEGYDKILVGSAIGLGALWCFAAYNVLMDQHDKADNVLTYVMIGVFIYQFVSNSRGGSRF